MKAAALSLAVVSLAIAPIAAQFTRATAPLPLPPALLELKTTCGGCTTMSPGTGWTCVNGGWVPPGHSLAALCSVDATPVPEPAPAPTPTPTPAPVSATCSGCTTSAPGSGWTCVNGGWLPPGHPLAESCTGGTPQPAPAPTPSPTPAPAPNPGVSCSGCIGNAPGSGWTCVNGGWLPPGHPMAEACSTGGTPAPSPTPTPEPAPAPSPTPQPAPTTSCSGCAGTSPGAGWVCVNGGWVPPGHPAAASCPSGSTPITTPTPEPPPPVTEPPLVPDPMLHQQWHLEARSLEPAGANVLDAWTTSHGTRSTIAIVDDGLQRAHADLVDNYRASLSRDFNDNDGDPTPASSDAHGTAAAGLAAARGGNGIGVSGVAPRAGLAGLRLIAAPASDAQVAEALGYLPDDIAIASNSWGPSDNGRTMTGPGPLTRAAIANALASGRGGKGRVFVWSAGNGGLGDDCNFDGYANNRAMIAVGAAADTGTAASYSEPCSALTVVAPSNGGSRGLVTTDLMGAAGYHASDYTTSFGGTSGAAPIVAGVAGLMLDRNPALTWRDVKAILRRTSVRLQPHESDWTPASYPHHHRYGFGLVDAKAAVAAAGAWTPLPPEQVLPPVTVQMNVTIPDANPGGVQDTIVISPPAGFIVEHVEVVLTVTHPYRGDLEVHLTSPSGVVSRIAGRRAGDFNANYNAWSFGSIRHWGETAAGPWTLKIADLAALDVGTWQHWTLRIYGRVGGAGQ